MSHCGNRTDIDYSATTLFSHMRQYCPCNRYGTEKVNLKLTFCFFSGGKFNGSRYAETCTVDENVNSALVCNYLINSRCYVFFFSNIGFYVLDLVNGNISSAKVIDLAPHISESFSGTSADA